MPKPLRILFADDHEIFRAGLRQVLANDRNIEIIAELGDGESALNQIPVLKPSIAVLDLDLPKRNGLEVARELSRQRDTTPIVILTGHREESLFEEALAVGVRGYLLKDNAASDLLSCFAWLRLGKPM